MKQLIRWSSFLALLLGLGALLTLLLQGPGYQAGWWGLGSVFFKVYPVIVKVGLAAAVLGLIAILGAKVAGAGALKLGLLGLVAGVAAAAVPINMKKTGQSVPAIHDITTDTSNPPQFVAIAPLRASASNPVTYDPAITAQQKEAYPDIQTIMLSSSVSDTFARALKAVDSMGWELVASDVNQGRIEATETTTWFGFKDDVVIRIKPSGTKTFVDIRSKSRVGRSDLGLNAERIRNFTKKLNP